MKSVLITGATSGIGYDLALKYLNEGFKVYACGRNKDKLASLAQTSSHLIPLAFDITNPEQIALALADIPTLNIVILNAGDCLYIDDAKQFDSKVFSSVITTNLISMGYMLELTIPKLADAGQLVFISSSVTLLPLPRAEAYGASKAGVDYLANTLRLDLAKHNIAVTLVHPGFIKTPLTDKNTFNMPFLLSSKEAAERVYRGVNAKKHYLQFPKRFTYILKIISWLPNSLWFYLATRKMTS